MTAAVGTGPFEPESGSAAEAAPAARFELPGLVMRRATWVALSFLIVVLVLGLVRAGADTRREMDGSLDLAQLNRVLAGLHDGAVDDGLRRLQAMPGLRHLRFDLRDETGRTVAHLGDEESTAWLVTHWRGLSARFGGARPAQPFVAYPVPLRDGHTWTAVLTASPDSEILEAADNLVGLVLLMLACCTAMLAAMHWNVRRSLRPLRTLVDAIANVERQQPSAVRALPSMPIRELEAIAQALRHLAAAQERSEAGRRVLAHRLMSLQEDERQRLARDLHDEFGQRLTALRVDAGWLQRAAVPEPKQQRVLTGMIEQIALIQDDVRRLLARLRPLGVAPGGIEQRPQTLASLRSMLEELVAGWAAAGRERGVRVELAMDPRDDATPLSPELALGLYRITQEALTNVMRHSNAGRSRVAIAWRGDAAPGRVLDWRVSDDGRGIDALDDALRRGTGLAGLKDRVWALGGRFGHGPGLDGRGIELRAEFTP